MHQRSVGVIALGLRIERAAANLLLLIWPLGKRGGRRSLGSLAGLRVPKHLAGGRRSPLARYLTICPSSHRYHPLSEVVQHYMFRYILPCPHDMGC